MTITNYFDLENVHCKNIYDYVRNIHLIVGDGQDNNRIACLAMGYIMAIYDEKYVENDYQKACYKIANAGYQIDYTVREFAKVIAKMQIEREEILSLIPFTVLNYCYLDKKTQYLTSELMLLINIGYALYFFYNKEKKETVDETVNRDCN